jgi:uncharacterized BrkB/YihY/UPF0761 family membrane protein
MTNWIHYHQHLTFFILGCIIAALGVRLVYTIVKRKVHGIINAAIGSVITALVMTYISNWIK